MDLALLFSSFSERLNGRKITQQRLLYEALRDAILDGLLPASTRLPATRVLANELRIARNSAMFASEQLAEEGFLRVSRRGSVVASVVASVGAQTQLKAAARKPQPVQLSRRIDVSTYRGASRRPVPSRCRFVRACRPSMNSRRRNGARPSAVRGESSKQRTWVMQTVLARLNLARRWSIT
jgi:DNA-binding transcriptional MocR family regulator